MKQHPYLTLCLFLAYLSFFSPPDSHAQSVKRQSIGSIGSGPTLSGISVKQSVGQPYFTGGYTSGEVSLRPGFQQSYFMISEKLQLSEVIQLSMYPNPAVSSVSIKSPVSLEEATVRVFDMQGRTVFQENVSGLRDYTINCQSWREGLYFVTLHDRQTNNRFSSKLIINK